MFLNNIDIKRNGSVIFLSVLDYHKELSSQKNPKIRLFIAMLRVG